MSENLAKFPKHISTLPTFIKIFLLRNKSKILFKLDVNLEYDQEPFKNFSFSFIYLFYVMLKLKQALSFTFVYL